MSDADKMPASPMTALGETAAQFHELFRSYVDAGFTDTQAMQLVCAFLTAMVAKGGA